MYGVWRLRLRDEILQSMVNHVVARTDLSDIRRGSNLIEILMSAAISDERLYLGAAELIKLFSIRNASGADLIERALDFDVEPIAAQSAAGDVYFSRSTSSGTITIPAETQVGRLVDGQLVTYRTTAAGTIEDVETVSAPVPVVAVTPGLSGNAPVSSITRIISRLAGVNSVTNLTAITGGTNQEGDVALRDRIREKLRSLARCQPRALEILARGVTGPDGRRVIVSRIVEEPDKPGEATLLIDDGTGNVESTATANETIISSATGEERRFQLSNFPVKEGEPLQLVLTRGGVDTPLNVGSDYHLRYSTGYLVLDRTAYPSGLTAADTLQIKYTHYTGLIAEVQWQVDGRGDNPSDYPGNRAAGAFVTVKAPGVFYPTISCTISVLDGYSLPSVRTDVVAKITDYLSSVDIGEDIVLAELIERVMSVTGMYDVLFSSPTGNLPVGDDTVARPNATLIEVN